MADTSPFELLVGPAKLYLAPVGTTVPDVDDVPASPWVLVGSTDGGQTIKHGGAKTYLRDDDHQGPVKAVTPEEEVVITTKIIGLTLENWARILNDVDDLVSAAGPPSTRTMNLKKGFIPEEYAVLLRGSALSPYGALPGMFVLPRAIFDGEPEVSLVKDEGAGLEIEIHALEDDNQTNDEEKLGWLVVQVP